MDWFKGKFWKPWFLPWRSWGFPVKCPLNQSIEWGYCQWSSIFVWDFPWTKETGRDFFITHFLGYPKLSSICLKGIFHERNHDFWDNYPTLYTRWEVLMRVNWLNPIISQKYFWLLYTRYPVSSGVLPVIIHFCLGFSIRKKREGKRSPIFWDIPSYHLFFVKGFSMKETMMFGIFIKYIYRER